MVDLRGYGNYNGPSDSYQLPPPVKQEPAFRQDPYKETVFATGKKSMIGHSDFVAVPDGQSTII